MPEFSFGVRNVREVYLIDTSPDQWRRIVGFDDEPSWIWQRQMTLDQVKAWSEYSAYRSRKLQNECQKLAKSCIDLAEYGFESAQELAFELLDGR